MSTPEEINYQQQQEAEFQRQQQEQAETARMFAEFQRNFVGFQEFLNFRNQSQPPPQQPLNTSNLQEEFNNLRVQLHELQSHREKKYFRMPSIKPPVFDGSIRHKPGPKATAAIYGYIQELEELTCIYGFRRSDTESTNLLNHTSIVQFAVMGFTGEARARWTKDKRLSLHPTDLYKFQEWIFKNFSSVVTLDKIYAAFITISQTGSVSKYNQYFNELLDAFETMNIDISPKLLCTAYRRGLKSHIRVHPDIYEEDEIVRIQANAEKIDEINYLKDKMPERTTESRYKPKDPNAMDLSNLNQHKLPRLTEAEKVVYKSKGWCVYCRSKNHTLQQCDAPGVKNNRQPLLNNIGVGTDEEIENSDIDNNFENWDIQSTTSTMSSRSNARPGFGKK